MLQRWGTEETAEMTEMAAWADNPRRAQNVSLIDMIMRYFCDMQPSIALGSGWNMGSFLRDS